MYCCRFSNSVSMSNVIVFVGIIATGAIVQVDSTVCSTSTVS